MGDRTSKNDENKNRVVKVQNSDESLISPKYGLASFPPMLQNKGPIIPLSFVPIGRVLDYCPHFINYNTHLIKQPPRERGA